MIFDCLKLISESLACFGRVKHVKFGSKSDIERKVYSCGGLLPRYRSRTLPLVLLRSDVETIRSRACYDLVGASACRRHDSFYSIWAADELTRFDG